MDKAYKLLLEPEQRKRALDVIHAGQEYVEHIVSVQHVLLLFRHSVYVSMLLNSHDMHLFGNVLFSALLCSQQVKEKRKQLKKDGKPLYVEEDDPEVVSQS